VVTALQTSARSPHVGAPAAEDQTRSSFRCECHASLDALAPRRRAWNTFVSSLGAPIYHSFEWCAAWWHHYGRDREARIFIAQKNGRLVGLLPMCIERLRLGPVTLRLARLIGSDSTHAVCDPPVDVDHCGPMMAGAIERLMGEDACDAVVFSPLAGDAPRVSALRAFCRQPHEWIRLVHDRIVGLYATIPLPKSIGEYERSLSKKQRYALRRGWADLVRASNAIVETVAEPERALPAFDEFARLHTEQWRAQGRLGHFADWPDALAFNRSLVASLAPEGRVRLTRLVADGELLASEYGLLFGRRGHWRLSARATHPRWNECGLGRLGLAKMLEAMIGEGVRSVEAGPGRYPYKRRLGADEHDLRSLLLVRNEAMARRRSQLAVRLADLLDRTYYRLWYLRVARRAPIARRPLLKAWIRSRL
jgi:CelD/BcsL family acetyltransferase involved in cellulose biosynthesis